MTESKFDLEKRLMEFSAKRTNWWAFFFGESPDSYGKSASETGEHAQRSTLNAQ
jgi:hypothetical protein